MTHVRRALPIGVAGAVAVSLLTLAGPGATSQAAVAGPATPTTSASAAARIGTLPLLTDPFLQAPTADGVSVVWMTETAGERHLVLVGTGVPALTEEQVAAVAAGGAAPSGVRVVTAASTRLSRTAEDAGSQLAVKPTPEQGIVAREVHRHEAVVTGLAPGSDTPYRVVSASGSTYGASKVFDLSPAAQPGEAQTILLTSDHQAMVNTPANLQLAKETVGDIDAVFLAGDLVNIPDRASEWFDDSRGSGFFPVLQGRGGRVSTGGRNYVGGEIVQEAVLYPAVGNHEVQGRIDGATGLNASFNAPVPLDVAERAYARVAGTVNPSNDPAVKAQWIEDNSFSTTTYEEIFSLPTDSPGGETYYATTVGDVRLVSLYSTRIWRGTTANADPAARTATSRYQESQASLTDPMAQGYGEHVFESLEAGSEQYEWLQDELASDEFQDAPIKVVILHEGPQGLGDNVMPVFADPERIETRDASGALTGVRYEYRTEDNMLLHDLQPILEDAGTDLVLNGHSHLWNRFRSKRGTNFLETSNTGNSYGAYHGLSGRTRPLPPAPWDASDYLSVGNPGGLKPITPTVKPFTNADGAELPFVQGNEYGVFASLDTGTNVVTTWVFDARTPDVAPWVIDRFTVGQQRTTTTATATRASYGARTTVSGEVSAHLPVASGEVTVADRDGRVLATAPVVDGSWTASLPARALEPGRHALTATFVATDRFTTSTGTVTATVTKAATRLSARFTAAKVRVGARPTVVVRAASAGVAPRGRVEVRRGKVLLRSAYLSPDDAGVLRVPLPAHTFRKPGHQGVTVRYLGSTLSAPATTRPKVRVARR
jgi:hypothetical protein